VADIDGTVDMINAVESARGQVAVIKARLGDDASTKEVRDAADALDEKLLALEENLFQVRVTGRGQDTLRWPWKLAEQLIYLAGQVTSGDSAPTVAQREVHELLHDQAKAYRQQLDQLVATDLAAFNTLLDQKGLAGVAAKP